MNDLAWTIAATVFMAGVGWGGAKAALNGTKKKVEDLVTFKTEVVDRLARIETKIDTLKERQS
jgi:hypothetical protein